METNDNNENSVIEQKTEENNTQEETTEKQFDLNISDLISLRSVLEISSRRGTWLAEELEDVGRLYKNLSGFLNKVLPKKEESTNSTDDSNLVTSDETSSTTDDKLVI